MTIKDAAAKLTAEVSAQGAAFASETLVIKNNFGVDTGEVWVVTAVRRKRTFIREDSIIAPYNSGERCPACSGTGKV